jgi:hypothetical protein
MEQATRKEILKAVEVMYEDGMSQLSARKVVSILTGFSTKEVHYLVAGAWERCTDQRENRIRDLIASERWTEAGRLLAKHAEAGR